MSRSSLAIAQGPGQPELHQLGLIAQQHSTCLVWAINELIPRNAIERTKDKKGG